MGRQKRAVERLHTQQLPRAAGAYVCRLERVGMRVVQLLGEEAGLLEDVDGLPRRGARWWPERAG